MDFRLIWAAVHGERFAWTVMGRAVLVVIADDTRAREWPHSATEIAAAAAGTVDRGFGLLLAAARELDCGDAVGARTRLADIVADPVLHVWGAPDAILQLAMWDALLAGDPAAARSRLDSKEVRAAGPSAALAEAATAVVEGRLADARTLLTSWRAWVAAQPSSAYARGGNHWAEDLVEERLRSAADVPPTGA
jgi:hypothetical protein